MRQRQRMLMVVCFAILAMWTAYGQVTSRIDAVQFFNADGTSNVVMSREILNADRTYYVRTDGNDNNTGLLNDATHAFRTLQRAANAYQALDCSGYKVIIYVADGTYTAGVKFTYGLGASGVYLIGNTSNPANVVLNVAGGIGVNAAGNPTGTPIYVKGFKFICHHGIYSEQSSLVIIDGPVIFGTCTGVHIVTNTSGAVWVNSGYSIVGGAAHHWLSENYGLVSVNVPVNVTLTGNPAFSSSFARSWIASIYAPGITFSGSATGARYLADGNGVIYVNGAGANYFPGNSAGSTLAGGQYY
jgi:hypothetical protein